MGLYDTVILKCPECDNEIKIQSKAGKCRLDEYQLADAPLSIAENMVDKSPFTCDKCGCVFSIELMKAKSIFMVFTTYGGKARPGWVTKME